MRKHTSAKIESSSAKTMRRAAAEPPCARQQAAPRGIHAATKTSLEKRTKSSAGLQSVVTDPATAALLLATLATLAVLIADGAVLDVQVALVCYVACECVRWLWHQNTAAVLLRQRTPLAPDFDVSAWRDFFVAALRREAALPDGPVPPPTPAFPCSV